MVTSRLCPGRPLMKGASAPGGMAAEGSERDLQEGGFMPVSKRAVALLVLLGSASVIFVGTSSAEGDCVQSWPPPNTFVYGQESWWSTNDIVQFVGDSGVGNQNEGGCSSYDQHWNSCVIDPGFTFRKITNYDPDECTFTEGTTCYVTRVRCCYFVGTSGICFYNCACGAPPV
jgi:hypothetical protein